MPGSLIQHSSNHKLLLLMISLLAVLLIYPFVGTSFVFNVALDIAYTLVLLSVIYVFYHHRLQAVIVIALALPLVASQWLQFLIQTRALQLLSFVLGAMFFIYLSSLLIKKILEEVRVTFDTIYGAISVYLMIGLGFAFLFGIVDYFYPESLQLNNGKSVTIATDYVHTLVYYSFTSLTTLGFGDINPIATLTRTLSYLEATIGQVYLVVMVARLVGLHIAHTHASSKQD